MKKTKKIDPSILYKIIQEGEYDKTPVDGYKFVEQTLLGSDDEDGGGDKRVARSVQSQAGAYAPTTPCGPLTIWP